MQQQQPLDGIKVRFATESQTEVCKPDDSTNMAGGITLSTTHHGSGVVIDLHKRGPSCTLYLRCSET